MGGKPRLARIATPDEREAIGLYAVLSRDAMDFYEMVREASPEVVMLLRKMLTTPHPNHDRATVELNAFGASLLPAEIA